MSIAPLMSLGIILFLAYLVKILSYRLKMPEVTGYVLMGVLLGGSFIQFLNEYTLQSFESVSSIALGIIAFIIGLELRINLFKKIGKSIIFIAVMESFGAFILVFIAMRFIMHASIPQSLLLGAVSSATAPAATVSVIRQYKASGNLTSTILAVVGIDDAFALIIYVFASSISYSMLTGEEIHILTNLKAASITIFLSIAVGTVMALLFNVLFRRTQHSDWIAIVIVAQILFMLGLAEQFKLSELLTIMVFSMIIVNLSPVLAKKAENVVSNYSPIFLAAFFIFGGAHLDIRLFSSVGLIGLVYLLARSMGKIGGGSFGAFLGKAPPKITKYVGFALLPQVGVALALALSINKKFNVPELGAQKQMMALEIINILLFTTIITEVIGPILTKRVLQKVNEIPSGKIAPKREK